MDREPARTEELTFSVEDLAAWLGPDAVSDVLAREDFTALLRNRRICLPREELERWLRELQERAREQHTDEHD